MDTLVNDEAEGAFKPKETEEFNDEKHEPMDCHSHDCLGYADGGMHSKDSRGEQSSTRHD
jgi:hypothetical protein